MNEEELIEYTRYVYFEAIGEKLSIEDAESMLDDYSF